MKKNLAMYRAGLTLLAALAVPVQVGAQDRADGKHKHHHYKLIDVGTFGGPNAYLSAPLPNEVQINRHGLVAGVADTPNPDPYSPNCLVDCYLARGLNEGF